MKVNNRKWKMAVLGIRTKIKEALENLALVEIQIVMVVDDAGVLKGTVNDGDIRRGLLNGISLEECIEKIIERNPVTASSKTKLVEIKKLMIEKKVRQIPIVDHNNIIEGLYLWDEVFAPLTRSNKLIIMAGGAGLRMRPYTENIPKPMLRVAGKPILERIIDKAKSEGFRDILISINYLGDQIEKYFANGSRFGVNIDYIREINPLGTAGALSLLPCFPDQPFVITNGDILTEGSYDDVIKFHQQENAGITIASQIFEMQNPYGVLEINGRQVENITEKPIYKSNINIGVYVLSKKIEQYLQKNKYMDMPELIKEAIKKGETVLTYEIDQNWIDIGSHVDFQRANAHYENT